MAHARQLSLNERRRRQKAREAARFNTMLKEIADAFSCSTRIATDFADQCELNRDNLEADLAFSDLALEVWQGRPGVEHLVTTLADLRATRQRHFEVIAVFVERLRQLAAADVHVHLTSDDINPGLVHQRIYPDPPSKS